MCIVHWVFNLQYKVRHVDVNIRMSIRNRATENARHEYTERQKVCCVISLNLNTGIARARSVSGNLVDFCKTVGYEKCHLKKRMTFRVIKSHCCCERDFLWVFPWVYIFFLYRSWDYWQLFAQIFKRSLLPPPQKKVPLIVVDPGPN